MDKEEYYSHIKKKSYDLKDFKEYPIIAEAPLKEWGIYRMFENTLIFWTQMFGGVKYVIMINQPLQKIEDILFYNLDKVIELDTIPEEIAIDSLKALGNKKILWVLLGLGLGIILLGKTLNKNIIDKW